MSYAAAYQLATALVEAGMQREQVAQDDARAQRIIDSVVHEINAAKQEILNALREMRIKDLMGDLAGLSESMDNYLRITNTRNFLEGILRDSDSLKGDLLQEVQGHASNSQMAVDAYPILLSHTALRVLLLSEFKYKWGADAIAVNDESRREIDETLSLGDAIIQLLSSRIEYRCKRRQTFGNYFGVSYALIDWETMEKWHREGPPALSCDLNDAPQEVREAYYSWVSRLLERHRIRPTLATLTGARRQFA